MKTKAGLIFMIGFLLCLTGCQNTEVSCATIAVQGPDIPDKTLPVFKEPVAEEEPCFTASYGQSYMEIPLSDCVCEYADADFQIYSKFIYYDKETFPYCGTIVYMQTLTESMQIYSPQDYCIDEENGIIYFLFKDENDSFSNIYKYYAEDILGEVSISGEQVVSTFVVGDWFIEAFALPLDKMKRNFSDMCLSITSLEYEQGDVILGGEASGICMDTGDKYHVDWKVNDTTKEESIAPHVFRIYDEEKDAEIFNACREAFDSFEQGDCSMLVPYEGMRYNGGGMAETGLRMDVNGDGLPELIYCDGYPSEDHHIFPVEYIYTYTGGMAKTMKLVYTDLNDYTEYLFPGNEYLIYDYSDHGQTDYGSYTRYQFDENWQRQPLDRIEIYHFYDADYYDEEEDARYKEYYPDTYGSRGGGYYFYKDIPIVSEESVGGMINDWLREEITAEEFAEIYREMTGFDFWEENTDFIR